METKFTKGPWYLNGTDKGPGQYYMHIGAKGSPMNLASINECHTQSRANSHLMAAAPDLYKELEEILSNAEQAEFEIWCDRTAPVGDSESIHYQWTESADYIDFVNEWKSTFDVLDKARGESC